MQLRRFLRTHDVTQLFAKAKALLEPGWGVGVVQAGRLLAAHGISEDDLEQPGALRFSVPLCGNLHPCGHVVVALRADHPASNGCQGVQQVADLLAHSLEMLLQQDEARRCLAADTLQKYRELSLLHRATMGLNTSLRLREVARALIGECRTGALPLEMGMLFLRDQATGAPEPFASFGPVREHQLDRVATSILFLDIMRGGKGEIVNDLDADSRWHGEAPGIKALIATPLVAAGNLVGGLVLATAQDAPIEANHLQYVSTLASVAGTAMGNAVHFEDVQSLLKALLQALATAIDARDPFTAGHSHRVARLAVALAKAVNDDADLLPGVIFPPDTLIELYYAGLLHDVGKIGVREQVLTKASRLPEDNLRLIGMRMALHAEITGTPWRDDFERLRRINRSDAISREDASLVVELSKQELSAYGQSIPLLAEEETLALLVTRGNLLPEERREIERHPAESYRILQHIPFPRNMTNLLSAIGQHHERLDGSGYPGGLKGDDISLTARLLMIVDIYDAITMERHYKPALPREKALLVLEEEAAQGKLDPRLVSIMIERIDSIEDDSLRMAIDRGYESLLGTNT
ncbi:3'3'-cGAMP-specific phosphodiesterase 3 [Fundidesulfovibrio magnetotacticus]|uniref:3'3'-cGAMP-specific phosphodiesterase 3 n=1 Tax=Fundidesulfovibrio magnetotacticus TaxID=2730080 RepID=A0A6V8LTA8_9BACT|nr:HD domain-containing phosphohydrolase [Fundidesulfovibrio magnetotacticus]GFK93319.1 3'3'-cGAMP-specific phosphodiesterase 3 [Fundidesulfovibrio magnetotacticus]